MMKERFFRSAVALLLCSGMVGCSQGAAPCGNDPLFQVSYGAELGRVVDGKSTMRANRETPLSIGTGAGVSVGSLGGSQACPVTGVRWTSSNPDVARVTPEDGAGVILKTTGSGTARITAIVSWNAGTAGRVDASFVGLTTTAYAVCATTECIGSWRYLDVTVIP